MEKYKSPKLKLKKKKTLVEPMAESSSDPKLVGSRMSDADRSTPSSPLGRMSDSDREVAKPKIIIRKAKSKSDPTIIDARAMTRETVKEEMAKQRLKRELKIKKKLQGM